MSSPGDQIEHRPTFDSHLARHAIREAERYQADCRARYDRMFAYMAELQARMDGFRDETFRYMAELQARVATLEAALADLTRRPNPTDRVEAP